LAVHDVAHEGPPALHHLLVGQDVELVVVGAGEDAEEVVALGVEPDRVV
jgi:hypothetical protein